MATTYSMIRMLLAVAAIAGLTTGALAQSSGGAQAPIDHEELGGDLYRGADLPPGVRGPYAPYADRERATVRPFGDVTEGRHSDYSPVNEFAGQTLEFEQGLIAEQLGRLKDTIIDGIADGGDEEAPQ